MLRFSVEKTIRALEKYGFREIAQILRQLHRVNPYPKNCERQRRMWNEQVGLNLPLLYLTCLLVHKYAQENNYTRFLFAARDCVHLHRIYQLLYPEAKVHYFACSRNMFEQARETNN